MKNGFGNVIVIILAIFALFGLISLAVVKNTKAPVPMPTPPVNPISPTIQATTTIDISSWKTYRNEKYGFEIKYPSDWSYSGEADFYPTNQPPATENNLGNLEKFTYFDVILLRGKESKSFSPANPDHLLPKNWFSYYYNSQIIDHENLITINGYPAIQDNPTYGIDYKNDVETWIFYKDEVFQISYDKRTIEHESLNQQILSTFKFFEPQKIIAGNEVKNEKICSTGEKLYSLSYNFDKCLKPYDWATYIFYNFGFKFNFKNMYTINYDPEVNEQDCASFDFVNNSGEVKIKGGSYFPYNFDADAEHGGYLEHFNY